MPRLGMRLGDQKSRRCINEIVGWDCIVYVWLILECLANNISMFTSSKQPYVNDSTSYHGNKYVLKSIEPNLPDMEMQCSRLT